VDFRSSRQNVTAEMANRCDAPVGQDQARDSACEPERHVFHEQLAHQPAAPGTDSHSHGKLAAAVCHSRKIQVCDIGAGDE
jgi:hypothetical protein